MFEQAEHEALMRLMTHALGHVDDSKRIAHWLQTWERGYGIAFRAPDLAYEHATDLQTVARAAKRTGAKPSILGRLEYVHKMENIERVYPLPLLEVER
jgi:hypothetical protein